MRADDCRPGDDMTRFAAIAMLALLGSAAAADDQNRRPASASSARSATPTPSRVSQGCSRFEDIGLCQEAQRTPPPWEHCGDCGMMRRWDEQLQIRRPPGR